MSIATILKNHKQFENVIENIIRYAQDIIVDLPHKKKKPTTDEKKMLIEALLLRACALWEKFIEKEVVLLIDLDPSKLLNEFDLPKNTNVTKLIRAIIFSDHYRDFHDIDRSTSFFDRVIVDKNNTFKKITKQRKGKINFIYRVRKLFNKSGTPEKIDFVVPEDKLHDFFRALIEAIYKKYIQTKLGGLRSSLTTFARSKEFYEAGGETYIALKNAYHLKESDFIEKNKYLIE